MQKLIAFVLIAFVACGGGGGTKTAKGPSGPKGGGGEKGGRAETGLAKSRTLDKDETIKTPAGSTFTASSGWHLEERPEWISLTTPERDLTMWLLERADATFGEAIAKGWEIVKPGFALKPAQTEEPPAREGWDQIAQIVYVTPAAESRLVVALALKKGATWYLALIDGKMAAFERRGAQLGTALTSFKAPGLEREDWAGKKANTLDAERLAQLDAFVQEALVATKTPGAAIAVVQGGKVIFEKGYGVREQGKKAAVTPKTLFMIGSTTKSLTTLMMARLVDAGKFRWDSPVTEVLPEFALGDENTTKSAQMRHTVCACTGMPRQDLEWIFEYKGVTPEQRLAEMKGMKPTTGFGETFQYSNLMVSVGGFAAARALHPKLKLGPAFDKAIQDQVFGPFGMKTATFDFKKALAGEHAKPHARNGHYELVAQPISIEEIVVALRPAGGAWASVRDLARVIQLELGGGALDGKQLVSKENLMARRAAQVKMSDEAHYGLGLFVEREHGVTVMGHGGNLIGFTSDLFFLPDHDVGFVILTNGGAANLLRGVVHRRVLEILFDGRAEAKDDMVAGLAQIEKSLTEEWALIKEEPDAAWFAELAGVWAAPGLGRIKLESVKGNAILDAGEWKVDVAQKTDRDGTVKLVTVGVPIAGIELIPTDKDGKKVLILDAGQHVYTFERQ
jgi:CubicO group peptidase (beta-lactamase class C family)